MSDLIVQGPLTEASAERIQDAFDHQRTIRIELGHGIEVIKIEEYRNRNDRTEAKLTHYSPEMTTYQTVTHHCLTIYRLTFGSIYDDCAITNIPLTSEKKKEE